MKATLLKLIQDMRRISVKQIHRQLGVDATSEDDRKQVWAIGQAVAQLAREGFIDITPDRVCVAL